MPTVVLSPIGGAGQQFFDNQGNVLSGGKLYTYAAGTTTPEVTYTTSSGTTPNPNPVVLNSAGRPTSEIWLLYQTSYKFVLKDTNDVLVYTWDNVINEYVYPAVLPAASGVNLTDLNASNIKTGTLDWARVAFTPENPANKNQPNGYAGLDGAGGLVAPPGAGSVLTESLAANAVTAVYTSNVVTSDVSTSGNNTYADTGIALTFTPTGGRCLALVNIPSVEGGGSTNGRQWQGCLNVDGTDGSPFATLGNSWSTNTSFNAPVTCVLDLGTLSAASHTIKVRHRNILSADVATIQGTRGGAYFTIIELKR